METIKVYDELTHQLLDIIAEAEKKYGQRSNKLPVVGVAGADRADTARTLSIPPGVTVELTREALFSQRAATYQLAHEAIHCLCADIRPNGANYLEEGVAAMFAFEYTGRSYSKTLSNSSDKYHQAIVLVCDLLDVDDDAIRKLREINPCLSFITKDDIVGLLPDVDVNLADNLAKAFYVQDATNVPKPDLARIDVCKIAEKDGEMLDLGGQITTDFDKLIADVSKAYNHDYGEGNWVILHEADKPNNINLLSIEDGRFVDATAEKLELRRIKKLEQENAAISIKRANRYVKETDPMMYDAVEQLAEKYPDKFSEWIAAKNEIRTELPKQELQ